MSARPGRSGSKDADVAIEGRTKWPRGGDEHLFPRSRRPSRRTGDAGTVAGILGLDAYDLPYTGTMAPRVTRLSGEARNTIVAATSSTFGHSA